MSTTTSSPSSVAHGHGAPAPDATTAATSDPGRALPVLAVDLVADPELLEGLADLARGLEAAGVGALTISDGGLHPIHVASHLAPLTRDVALLPRTDAVYVEPFHLATQLMSLDHISHGRAGWLLTAETDPAVAAAVGRTTLGLEATAREAADVLEASRLIWDSWAPDAVVRDTGRGVYVDASRLQYADFTGETFSVRGPAITPRSPQGLVPVLVADTDRAAAGERAAVELADGRALDLDVSTGSGAVLETVDAARADEDGPPVHLVRLVGLDLEADPLGTVTELATALREQGLVAPAPTTGQSLREQLGLPLPPYSNDPARRSDRARLTSKDPA
ncbi:LLM class flavin-dependent oxidoreductase [Brachybacterium sacelli]|uniref:Alkanesulfonate monooxygenase SsuD/methylene tetrahydromethanopterin reductase-like flavin-dependent oxidoreductase (Luciferase family) n=1 Tax=Brachybacterium sacelli TaxID=173364 RepID=A0ABS4WXX2_9MICO|nr:alkanesulfonate monooxygenase SsuD/methylene tetrahydromethanopterin reductase-like flavin-dependent oxidoreductase (luciferase family) [Brachybacterium sacelli]